MNLWVQQLLSKIGRIFSSNEHRPKIFYAAAFAPLILIIYYHASWPFDIAIPMYGFILLVIKQPKLFRQKEAGNLQRSFGLLLMLGSFLLYFAFVPLFPDAAFYGVGNYALYILSLCLVFFDVHALREAFSPLFLIVATTSTSFFSALAEPFLTPYIPNLVSMIVAIVRLFGVRADVEFRNFPIIRIHTPTGLVSLGFVWGCVGFASTLLFSIILVIILFEETCSLRKKILWSIAGLTGMFFLNLLRAAMILMTDYFYGYEAGAQVHYFIGYAIFFTWTSIFFYLFSRSQAVAPKEQDRQENSALPTVQ
jgi:exosortase/archaeosortase family protein